MTVRPPRIEPGEGVGKYAATVDLPRFCPIACSITYADVAMFLLDAAGGCKWDGNAVQLYSAKIGRPLPAHTTMSAAAALLAGASSSKKPSQK